MEKQHEPPYGGKMARGRLLNIQSDSSSAGSLFDSSSSDGYIPEDDDSDKSHWYYGPQPQVVYDQNHTPPIPVNIKIEDTSQNWKEQFFDNTMKTLSRQKKNEEEYIIYTF